MRQIPAVCILLLLMAQDALAQSPDLKVHLTQPCSSPTASRPQKDPGAPGSICLDRTPFLTTADVESAQIHTNAAGHPVIMLAFKHEAAMRELQVTRKNIGNRVAILLNGRVVAAPKIPGASRMLFIDGNFTQPQADALVAGFNREARGHD
jgi:preprotein translocase subunit SecD